MSIGDFLFGSSPEVTESSRSLLSPEQQASLVKLLPSLQQQAKPGAVGAGGLTGTSQDILRQITSAAGDQPGYKYTSPIYESSEAALLNLLGGGGTSPEAFDEYFRTTVQDPLVQSFKRDVIPSIGLKFGTNLFSSAREDFTGRQVEELGKTLAQERAKLAYEDRNRAIQNQIATLGLAPAIEQIAQTGDMQSFDQLLQAFNVSDVERQAILQDETLRQNILSMLLSASTGQTVENIAVATPGSAGLLGNLLSGASEGIGQGLGARLAGG